MRITIVNGFFLPVPPISGGSTEKSWFQLGREFAAQGHDVLSISRQWRQFPDREQVDGVHHLRVKGYDHRRELWRNLLCDVLWSWRVYRQLPAADIIVCNAVTLPMWLGRHKPSAGRVVVMCGRMPKGQYRRYRDLARVLAPSSLVQSRLIQENPALAPLIRVSGYPISYSTLSTPQPVPTGLPSRSGHGEVVLGFVGRLNEEKGLMLLADALGLVAQQTQLPPWKVMLCGPCDIESGGSGAGFKRNLISRFARTGIGNRLTLLDPQFNERTLAAIYQQMDVFCYPSLAESGETFGVAVAEAMAAGAVPVVSQLACFKDFVRDGQNGLQFDHKSPDAVQSLAQALIRLIGDHGLRQQLAQNAKADVLRFDFPVYARELLRDFATLL